MKVYRYPTRTLLGDYVRSAVGFGVGAGVLLSVPPQPVIFIIFGSIAVLFGAFGLRTMRRNIAKVAVSETEIYTAAPTTRVIRWNELQLYKLRYYGSKRQEKGSGGFMQLTLTGSGESFCYESSLEGFDYIAWRAAKALRHNGITMDPASAGNLLAIGLDADGERPPPDA